MNANDQPMICLQGARKIFYAEEVETHALADVNLEIRKGEYVSIAGPSGSGKSTLLSILGLLEPPTDGDYLLNGRSVADLSPADRSRIRNREIGFIFQSFNLIGDLSGSTPPRMETCTRSGAGGSGRRKDSSSNQRSKIRDLHDLAEISRRPINRDLIRTLAVLKLWNAGGPGLNFGRFRERVQDRRNYDIADLEHLLRRDQNPDLEAMIREVVDGFRFLERLTELEQIVAADQYQRCRAEAAQLLALIG